MYSALHSSVSRKNQSPWILKDTLLIDLCSYCLEIHRETLNTLYCMIECWLGTVKKTTHNNNNINNNNNTIVTNNNSNYKTLYLYTCT